MARCALSGTKLDVSSRSPSVAPRVTPRVCASAEQNRRQVLGGLAAGIALLPAAAANAVTKIRIDNNISSKPAADLFVEAADFTEDIRVRRGELQYRNSVDATKARVAESKKRLTDVVTDLQASRWTASRNELRLQTGYLRYDLDVLTEASSNKAQAQPAADSFVASVESLDYALSRKDMEASMAAYNKMISSLDAAMAALA